jgi:glycosyltransferase involved in cell wall biosynthesis
MHKLPVSVVVSSKNEEKNIRKCLEKLYCFGQVVVVDSFSTDKTKEIVSEYGFTIIDFKWNGKFPKKRNWTLRNVKLEFDWVLFLDADEMLTTEVIDEIGTKIKSTKYNGYWLSYKNFFLGKELHFGDEMRKLALFKKQYGEYECIEENSWSHLDMEIHEHPIVKGLTSNIRSKIIHNDYNGIEHYISKHNAYSTWESLRYLQLTRDSKLEFTFRQRVKYKFMELQFFPTAYFIYAYLFRLGFLDGKSGYYLAKLKANYFLQIKLKILENRRDRGL